RREPALLDVDLGPQEPDLLQAVEQPAVGLLLVQLVQQPIDLLGQPRRHRPALDPRLRPPGLRPRLRPPVSGPRPPPPPAAPPPAPPAPRGPARRGPPAGPGGPGPPGRPGPGPPPPSQAPPPPPTSSTATNAAVVATRALCRRASLPSRYQADCGRARIGS